MKIQDLFAALAASLKKKPDKSVGMGCVYASPEMMSNDWLEKTQPPLEYPGFFANDDPEITMIFCEVCRQSIPANAIFCPYCGTKM